MIELRSLTGEEFPLVHAAFLKAFSDYTVPLRLSEEDLREMVSRRGYVPAASVGIFDGDQLVAFTLNGIGTWNGMRTGYDTGTGVVPSHRSRGLSAQMIEASFDLLRAHGAEQYLLEVLQSNDRARGIYQRAGFGITRELQCWGFEPALSIPTGGVAMVPSFDRAALEGFIEIPPSWQNSLDSIARARAPRTVLAIADANALLGCAVVFASGDLPFLAVAPSARHRGLGRDLLFAAARATGVPLRIINVDAGNASAAAFLERCGAVRTVRQYEMLRKL